MRATQFAARNQPICSAMSVKVLVGGYATGVFSSRKRKRKRRLHEALAFSRLGTVAIVGTKRKANASPLHAMSDERMHQAEDPLKAQIDALLERAKTINAAAKATASGSRACPSNSWWHSVANAN